MSEKRYKIVVTEIATEDRLTERQWVQGGSVEPSEKGWGYTPQIPTRVLVTREVYSQNTDTLNLVDVIRAVNRMVPQGSRP